MASNRTKYSEEMRNETAAYIIERGKSATSMAEELGIDKNTVCKWVRDYRRKNNLLECGGKMIPYYDSICI